MKPIKCPICGDRFTKSNSMYSHMTDEHGEDIPEDYSPARYAYYLRTGKTHGSCIVCRKDTMWNDETEKYKRFCGNPKCKEAYRKQFESRMIGKHGKVTLLNDPKQQRLMLSHRHISGEYTWSDGSKKTYTGTYELDFLKMLDVFMNFDSDDIIAPSPHTYYYMYEGEKKFYIPDFYIPSIGLEIEIKDGGRNPNTHHKIQDVDKVKERLKDEVMKSQKDVDYIKVVDKNYDNFFKYLLDKKRNDNDTRIISSVSESFNLVSEAAIMVDDKTIKSPRELQSWMRSNIKYDHPSNWKFRSPDEVMEDKKGDCHDQSSFEYSMLHKLGYKCGRLFMIEYSGDEIRNAGATHTACYFVQNNKYFWFENAWSDEAGIHGPYNSLNDLKDAIYDKWNFSSNCDKLFMGGCGGIKSGMDLEEYVTTALNNNFKPKSFYTKNKSMKESLDIAIESVGDKFVLSPIYLVLTKGNTPIISPGIRHFTNSEFTHSSISFDESLKEIYSFNFLKEHSNGFVKESLATYKQNAISVYVFFVEKLSLQRMKETIEEFRQNNTMYDFRVFAMKVFDIDKRPSENKFNQVCSTFVDTVLKSGGINLFGDKKLPVPSDFYNKVVEYKDKVFNVFTGPANTYDAKKVRHKIYKLHGKHKDTAVVTESETLAKDNTQLESFIEEIIL